MSDDLLTEIRDLLIEIRDNTRRKTPPPKCETRKQQSPKWGNCQFVRLTDDEYGKLAHRYGVREVDKLITRMDTHVGATGRGYKDYYLAVIKWADISKIPETYEFRQLEKSSDKPDDAEVITV